MKKVFICLTLVGITLSFMTAGFAMENPEQPPNAERRSSSEKAVGHSSGATSQAGDDLTNPRTASHRGAGRHNRQSQSSWEELKSKVYFIPGESIQPGLANPYKDVELMIATKRQRGRKAKRTAYCGVVSFLPDIRLPCRLDRRANGMNGEKKDNIYNLSLASSAFARIRLNYIANDEYLKTAHTSPVKKEYNPIELGTLMDMSEYRSFSILKREEKDLKILYDMDKRAKNKYFYISSIYFNKDEMQEDMHEWESESWYSIKDIVDAVKRIRQRAGTMYFHPAGHHEIVVGGKVQEIYHNGASFSLALAKELRALTPEQEEEVKQALDETLHPLGKGFWENFIQEETRKNRKAFIHRVLWRGPLQIAFGVWAWYAWKHHKAMQQKHAAPLPPEVAAIETQLNKTSSGATYRALLNNLLKEKPMEIEQLQQRQGDLFIGKFNLWLAGVVNVVSWLELGYELYKAWQAYRRVPVFH